MSLPHLRRIFPLVLVFCGLAMAQPQALDFDPDRAYAHLRSYMDLSPITPGSASSETFSLYVTSHLQPLGFQVVTDTWKTPDAPVPLRNLLGTQGSGKRIVLIGAHYDTRLQADRDPDPSKRHLPVPGANDGGSGVAVLLELARAVQLPQDLELRLAFFDAEDQGSLPGYGGPWGGWILGSHRMATNLTADERARIQAVIIVDIVGDPQLRIFQEGNSDPALVQAVWQEARQLGYGETFLERQGAAITDDHLPFKAVGLPVLDLIQLEGVDGSSFFTWHHTTLDTLEHVSRASLAKVGRTLESYLESDPGSSKPPLSLNRTPIFAMSVPVALGFGVVGFLLLRQKRRRMPAGASGRKRR